MLCSFARNQNNWALSLVGFHRETFGRLVLCSMVGSLSSFREVMFIVFGPKILISDETKANLCCIKDDFIGPIPDFLLFLAN